MFPLAVPPSRGRLPSRGRPSSRGDIGKRTLLLSVLLLVLPLWGSCGARAAVQEAQQHQIRAFAALELGATSEGEREIELPLGQDDTLIVEHPFGDVEIRTVEEGSPRATAWIEVSAADEKSAERVLRRSQLRWERGTKGLRLHLEQPERATLGDDEAGIRYVSSARLLIETPPGTRLSLEIGRGNVEAIGPLGATRVVIGHGDIRLRQVRGGAIVRSSTGDIKLRQISGGPVKAETSFGLIALLGSRSSSIQLTNRRGRIVVNNAEAPSLVIRSAEGTIKLSEIEGEIEAETDTGTLLLTTATGRRIDLRSGYGKVAVQDVHALELVARAERGDLHLENSAAELLELRSDVGDIVLTEVEGNLTAHAPSGRIDAAGLRGERLALHAGLGGLAVDRAAGSLEITSTRGRVSVSSFDGDLRVESEDGGVGVEGVLRGLHAACQSGRVRVKAREGSRVLDPWTLRSEFGDVTLFLPPELGFDIEATTGVGIFDSSFPILVEAGLTDDGDLFRGTVQGGGGRIVIETVRGNVALRRTPRKSGK
jgi:DUF4097 and DUF4098 domain-containing protein YvlB